MCNIQIRNNVPQESMLVQKGRSTGESHISLDLLAFNQMRNVSTENGQFSANINKRGVCQGVNGASANQGLPDYNPPPPQSLPGSKGTLFLLTFTLFAGGKGAGHLFYGKKGKLMWEPLREMVLFTCREVSLFYSILSYSRLFYPILSYCFSFTYSEETDTSSP